MPVLPRNRGKEHSRIQLLQNHQAAGRRWCNESVAVLNMVVTRLTKRRKHAQT